MTPAPFSFPVKVKILKFRCNVQTHFNLIMVGVHKGGFPKDFAIICDLLTLSLI